MNADAISIGVLFSQDGHMAVTENAHLQGVLLACEEINAEGGVNGRPLQPIIQNPSGEISNYVKQSTDLLLNHRTNVIFGCCLSTSRKAVLPVVERFNGVLFYPSVYEGFEYSPNVIYGGAVPNQMILPLLEYLYLHHGKRIALVGSETLYAHEINRITKEFLSNSDGHVVKEVYLPFSITEDQVEAVVKGISHDDVDVVLSTIVGQDSVKLYNAFDRIKPLRDRVPIASLTTTESELAQVNPSARAGHISVSSYFGSIKTPSNEPFVAAFQNRYGEFALPSVYGEVAYSLVHLFSNAVRIGNSVETESILDGLSGAVFKGPSGDQFVEMETNHITKRSFIGLSNEKGAFDLVWKSQRVTRPDPYLVSYDRYIGDVPTQ